MGKEKVITAGNGLLQVFQLSVYKRSQGRITRQVTCAAVWVAFLLGAWRCYTTVVLLLPREWCMVICAALLLVGGWLGFRIVNVPRFADFLIAVEAEMNKVSWPSRAELMRSTFVVIFLIGSLAIVLFGFDIAWQRVFQWLGVLQ
jgi:preprotein translocase subunit SecE